jgi:broad specificity phosphatase PhoE
VNLVLVRPGRTQFDSESRIAGSLSVGLDAVGEEQVRALAPSLSAYRPELIVYGPEASCRQTAEILAFGQKTPRKECPALHNWRFGLWEGATLADLHRRQPTVMREWEEHPDRITPPEGETLFDASERCAAALNKLERKYRTKNIALVVCEPLAGVIERLILGGAHTMHLAGHGMASVSFMTEQQLQVIRKL